MTPAEAQLHIRYNHWASGRILDAVAAISPEERERSNGISHGSILGTLAHLQFVDWIWYTRVVEPLDRPADALGAIQSAWPEIQRRWEAWSEGLTDADLARNVVFKRLTGEEAAAPAWQIVMHLVNHDTLHRGQIMGMLRQLGVAPPPTDLIAYYMTLKAGRASA
jgi:uncharacterized damage-inducible protein DinB